jgi:hypothetical protein
MAVLELTARQVLLDLLDAGNSGAVQSSTLLTLVCALLDHPQNTRVRIISAHSVTDSQI